MSRAAGRWLLKAVVSIMLAVTVLPYSAPRAAEWDIEPPAAAVVIVVGVLGTNIVADAVNTSRLINGNPKPVMGYVGLATGLVILGRGLTLDDPTGLTVGLTMLGAVSTVLSGVTIYAAHTRDKSEAAVAPLISPIEESGVSVGVQMRLTF
jgi:hypothetical protein